MQTLQDERLLWSLLETIIIFQEDSRFKTGYSLPCPELLVQLFPGEEGKASNFSKQAN